MSEQIQIAGLSVTDVNLLDTIWALDTVEEVAEFRSLQDEETQIRIDALIDMVRVACIDADVDEMDFFPDAAHALDKFTLQ